MHRVFTRAQVRIMRRVQELHMPDGCIIHRFAGEKQDDNGQPIPKYDPSDVTPCGFTLHFSMERFVDSGEGQKFFYEVRLSSKTPLDKRDLVEMVHRGGEPVPKRTLYEVSGEPRYGITATLAGLKEHVP